MGSEAHFAQFAVMGWAVPGVQEMIPNIPMHMAGANLVCHQQQPMMCQQHFAPRQPQRFGERPPAKLVQRSQVVDPQEVTAAVETLYADQLKPYGRILRKRLAERTATNRNCSVDVGIDHLKSICEACSWLYLEAGEGGDWFVLLQGRPSNFVDVYSPHDSYPDGLWQEASAYFESLDDACMVLPGGRYCCAQALVSRGLQFLTGLTLGQISHVVQLAISQKKILGYLNGAVVPYGRSQSKIKERCAENQKPCAASARLADWDILRKGLREILDSLSAPHSIPLSNIKRMFRSRYQLELSETSLGHAKLSELLQDQRLRDICFVRLQGHGYVVSPATAELVQQQQQQQQQQQMVHCQPQKRPQPMPMSSAAAGAAVVAAAAAAACGQPTPPQAAHLLQKSPISLEFNQGSCSGVCNKTDSPVHGRAAMAQPAGLALRCDLEQAAAPTTNSTVHQPHTGVSLRDRARFVGQLSMEDVDQASFLQSDDMLFMTPTPNALHFGAKSVSRIWGFEKPDFEAIGQMTGQVFPQSNSESGTATPDVLQNPYTVPMTSESPGFPRWAPMTPNTLASMGYNIQNTFINFTSPPPTPLPGSTLRSMSLPRNMGASDTAKEENSEQPRKMEKNAPRSLAGAQNRPANRLMSAAAAAATSPVHTPRGVR